MSRLQMLVYRSDRCWRDKLSKCIGLHSHCPWSKHLCWSLILCLHWHQSNAYSSMDSDWWILVKLLSESPIARAYYRALFSRRLLFFSYFRTMRILSIKFTISYHTYCTKSTYIPVTRLPKRLGWHIRKGSSFRPRTVAHSAPYDTFK